MDVLVKDVMPMPEMFTARIYEFIIILYAIGIVLYFIDYVYKNPKARRVAFWIVCVVWLTQSIYILLFMIQMQRFPILSLFEGIYFYAWLLITLSIGLHCIAKVDMPVFFVNVLGFVFMTIHLFAPKHKNAYPMVESQVSEMLFIHIGISIASYGAFTIAFVFSVLYIILYNILKKKKFSTIWTRLPNLAQTMAYMNYSTIVGVPLLIIALVLGVEWALITLDGLSVFDIKIIGSFIILGIYLCLFLLNKSGKLIGTTYAWFHIYAFLLVVINFFLGNRLSTFHFWS